MIVLTQGKQLGAGDLSILWRDNQGALVDPIQLTYSIFQTSTQLPKKVANAYELPTDQPFSLEGATLASQPKSVPARASLGAYFINMTIPANWFGAFRLVWYVTPFEGCREEIVFEDFVVEQINPLTTSFEAPSVLLAPKQATTSQYAPAIMYVRELLSDTNPDRNYHFRPPTPGKSVAGFTSRVGFIWLDSTILVNLEAAIEMLNTWNMKTYYNYTLDSVPAAFGKCAAKEAASLCLLSEGNRWAADEFSYSLNGVSLDINKATVYQSLGQTYHEQFVEWAERVTAIRPFSAGLRQQRWLLG